MCKFAIFFNNNKKINNCLLLDFKSECEIVNEQKEQVDRPQLEEEEGGAGKF